jgi:hypothetical protein
MRDNYGEKTPARIAIETVLNKKPQHIYVARVDSDVKDMYAAVYFKHFGKCLTEQQIDFEAFQYRQLQGDVNPQTYIISSEQEHDAMKMLNNFVQLLRECPDGPIMEGIRQEEMDNALDPRRPVDRFRPTFDDFLKKVKKEKKKVLVMHDRALYYRPDGLQSVYEHLIPYSSGVPVK